ncbi:MAG: DUF364 domain-containing protein [Candidatus Magasanikiibacteriota bacterium]
MDISLENIRNWVINKSIRNKSNGVVIINGLWRIRCLFQPTKHERFFNYHILVAQTLGQGACYYEKPELSDKILESMIGQEYKGYPTGNENIDIALLDSLAISFNSVPDFSIELPGLRSHKALTRADIIVDEALRISNNIRNKKNRKVKVCIIGVVSLIVEKLLQSGFIVSACDREKNLIGKKLFNKVIVESATKSLDIISNSDIAIITGMALSTGTLSELVSVARKNKTKIILFAQTGAGFAPFYIRNNIDSVVSEPFPFYTFDGHTKINVYRAIK